MRKTGWGDLAVPFVIIGIATYVLLRSSYDSLPPLQYVLPIPIAALAVVEFVAARRVRAAVRHEPHAKPITAINVARCVALGKASALVGSAVAGAAAGLLARLLPDVGQVSAAAHDAEVGAVVLLVSVLLVVCGLLLERAGIDPNSGRPPDGEKA
jgi:hypothetical protein